jgi:RNA polymerase primary sigma factor
MQTHALRYGDDPDGLATLDRAETEVLGAKRERELLRELSECKQTLAEALAAIPGVEFPDGADDPRALSQSIASHYAPNGPAEAQLGAVYRRYNELRTKLALANLRLVAHVAKRFRDRGVSLSDLMQEGFCGLLEAIDRFNLTHETKLATYATWWIRQAMQRAVAGGAYPVRLSPRHLRQLAQSQDEVSRGDARSGRAESPSEMIRRIHAATRPTLSLDAGFRGEGHFNLLQTMSDPDTDRIEEVDTEEAIGKLLDVLQPREQRVVSLRFGLGGQPRLSLSQVGKLLEISKERVRQIQDRALVKLRDTAEQENLSHTLMPD